MPARLYAGNFQNRQNPCHAILEQYLKSGIVCEKTYPYLCLNKFLWYCTIGVLFTKKYFLQKIIDGEAN
ncbi:MAG: hypothetical protein DRJ05_09700 [Bacteroidetes bacterium]|nr:MAG: hypothetical protein DRJ05_09700 [Bacteroidota bacterium]